MCFIQFIGVILSYSQQNLMMFYLTKYNITVAQLHCIMLIPYNRVGPTFLIPRAALRKLWPISIRFILKKNVRARGESWAWLTGRNDCRFPSELCSWADSWIPRWPRDVNLNGSWWLSKELWFCVMGAAFASLRSCAELESRKFSIQTIGNAWGRDSVVRECCFANCA